MDGDGMMCQKKVILPHEFFYLCEFSYSRLIMLDKISPVEYRPVKRDAYLLTNFELLCDDSKARREKLRHTFSKFDWYDESAQKQPPPKGQTLFPDRKTPLQRSTQHLFELTK